MKEKTKKILFGGIALATVALLSSCNSFCSDNDVSNYMYGYDTVNTTFFGSEENGLDYIKDSFKKVANVDAAKVDAGNVLVEVNKLAEEGKIVDTAYSKDLVFGEYNENLLYFKPVTLKMKEVVVKDGNATDAELTFGFSTFTSEVITSARKNGIKTPSFDYFSKMDIKAVDEMLKKVDTVSWLAGVTKENLTYETLYGYTYADYKVYRSGNYESDLLKKMKNGVNPESPDLSYLGRNNAVLARLGAIKFTNEKDVKEHFAVIESWQNDLIKEGILTSNDLPGQAYWSAYQSTLNIKVANLQTCITVEDGYYGAVSDDELNNNVLIEGKGQNFYEGWGNAFKEHGFLEGLLVYPLATMVENFSHAFGMNGVGQIFAVILTTVIVRLLFMLVTLPATISQQKMQYLQPELAKLQAKYPNSKENQYEKQKMAQAQMALYKKNKVHPFLSFLTIIVQFPVFICVWNAMRGSASLSSDAVLGLRLSDTIWNTLTKVNGWPGIPGWWTALVLFILMGGAQVVAMMIPNWLNKRRMKKVEKLGVNPAQDQNNKTMKITQWVMTIVIILMGFTLPSAMGVYWLAGALFSAAQSLIMHFVFEHKYGNK